MIDQFYSHPSSPEEHLRLGPLCTYIDVFAQHLAEQGYARWTVKEKIHVVAGFSRWLQSGECRVENLDEQVVSEFLRYRRRKGLSRHGAASALRDLLRHLRNAGIIPCARQPESSPLHDIEVCFARYLTEERGLAQRTLDNYLPLVCTFLSERFDNGPIALDKLTPKDITGFILHHSKKVSPRRAQVVTTVLRSFFRFLYERGKIAADLAASVPTVANWQQSTLPKFLEPEQVERLIQVCSRTTPAGRRDYAVLLLLARLGLRAGEVAHMELDDIDWENGELMVRGKSVRNDRLPIPKDVGEALACYLCDGRPHCSSRRVFLRLRAPLQGFTNFIAVCNIVQRAFMRAGLNPERRGSHLLRHSLATQMLRGGASLAEIGEVLRHQLPSTTEIYTKVDVTALRALALPWKGGDL
jgi:site-specific recombinase XerD